jgi:hypothetical protein
LIVHSLEESTCAQDLGATEEAQASTAAAETWPAVYENFVRRDEKMIKMYQEQIDSLLIFVRLCVAAKS